MPTAPEPHTSDRDAVGVGDAVDLTGRTLDGFHVLRLLGAGGMGQVYLAEQLSLKRKVAFKTLKPSLAATATARQRFRSEAENVAKFTHPNIVQVYQTGVAEGIPYIALEYVEGRNLRDYLARKGPPDLLAALSIMRQVASALQRASELGLIHRDIKPDNILLTRKGEAKVTDFGLSRVLSDDPAAVNLTGSGVTMGTPLYMAPEQVEGKPVDARTDIYSFGVTCYHLLAGHPPYQGTTPFEVALQHVRGEPVRLSKIRPDLPEMLVAIVHKMMERDPAQRYQTCRELLRDLVRLRETLTGQSTALALDDCGDDTPAAPTAIFSPAPGTMPVPTAGGSLSKWLLFLLAALLLAAGGAALAWYVHRPPALPPVQPAELDPEDDNPLKREQALRDAVKHYFKEGGPRTDAAAGYILARDLGLLYLELGKLEEAVQLFAKLEAHKTVKAYQLLGKLGRAIVLGLRATKLEDAQRSTTDIRESFQAGQIRPGGPRRIDPEVVLWTDPRIRFWATQALWHNARNGVPLTGIPPQLTPRPAVGFDRE